MIESISDVSWTSEPFRRSISSPINFLNGIALHREQEAAKASQVVPVRLKCAVREGLLLKRIAETLCGHPVPASRRFFIAQIIHRSSKFKSNIDIAYLWVQDHRARNMIDLKQTPTKFCPPDLPTKNDHTCKDVILHHGHLGRLVGQEEFEEEWSCEHLK